MSEKDSWFYRSFLFLPAFWMHSLSFANQKYCNKTNLQFKKSNLCSQIEKETICDGVSTNYSCSWYFHDFWAFLITLQLELFSNIWLYCGDLVTPKHLQNNKNKNYVSNQTYNFWMEFNILDHCEILQWKSIYIFERK